MTSPTVCSINNISTNGEAQMMRYLIEKRLLDGASVIFDVGANSGEWTAHVLELLPNAQIHSFEPIPEVARDLKERFAASSNVSIFEQAVSDRSGSHTFHVYDSDTLSGFYVRDPNQVRKAAPRAIPVAAVTLDQHCSRAGINRIHFLKIDVEGAENSVLRGAQRMLERAGVDLIQFEYGGTFRDAEETLESSFHMLRGHGYELFKITPRALAYHPRWNPELENYQYSNFLAVHERLASLLAGKQPRMLDLASCFAHYGLSLKGVIHVGAHEGQEARAYRSMGASRMVFVEANPKVFQRLEANLKNEPDTYLVNCAVSDRSGTIDLHVTNMDQSSSILPLARHKEIYPQIVKEQTVRVQTKTLDAVMSDIDSPLEGYNFLSLDIQGAELLALSKAEQTLGVVDAVLTEANWEELYEGAPSLYAIDDLLHPYGFHRVATTCPYHPSWGDALYLRTPRDPHLNNPFGLPATIGTMTGDAANDSIRKFISIAVSLYQSGMHEKLREVMGSVIQSQEQLIILTRALPRLLLEEPRAEVEGLFITLLDQYFPGCYPLVMLKGKIHEKTGETDKARTAFAEAVAINPGHGEAFTRHLLLNLPPLDIQAEARHTGTSRQPNRGFIALPSLGKDGRFANQLFQYAFGYCYAEKFRLRLQVPKWIGRPMFGLLDEEPAEHVPLQNVAPQASEDLLKADRPLAMNTAITGYFNHHSAMYAPFQTELQKIFQPRGAFKNASQQVQEWMASLQAPVIAIHLRRGDFGYGKFWIAPDQWYLDWLDQVVQEEPSARLYIATDDLSVIEAFARFNPLTLSDSAVKLPGFEFFLDFQVLVHAHQVAISNSTFSFFASMLNQRSSCFMRPDPQEKALRPYTPWSAPVML